MATPKLKRTLYIGLGGTGFKTLLHTKRAFIETYGEVPPMIKFLAIDSDKNEYNTRFLPSIYGDIRFDPSEISDISVQNAPEIVLRHRDSLSWLPNNNLGAVIDLTNGCGMVRTNGRIAFALNYAKTKQNIHNAINQITNLNIQQNSKYQLLGSDIEVNFVFSIGGGTGSGNFLDTAYMVKSILKSYPNKSMVIGYMILPDVYKAQLQFDKERLGPNGYASLVDFDYLMHLNFGESVPVNYLTTSASLSGKPFDAVMAISNKNQNGDMVDNCESLAEMLSGALVVSAGELSGGINSIANNFQVTTTSGTLNIENKRAIFGTLGMSKIVFKSSELSALYRAKAAREIAALLLAPGCNLDIAANTWIDNERIRENNGRDDVIDQLHEKTPRIPFTAVTTEENPLADVNAYKSLSGVKVSNNELNDTVSELKNKVKSSFDDVITSQVDNYGPQYSLEFIAQLRAQIDICISEMRNEKQEAENKTAQLESAVNAAVEDYKKAKEKWIGKKLAVEHAEEAICGAVNAQVINDREISRRNGAISFYTWLLSEMDSKEQKLRAIKKNIEDACQLIRARISEIDTQLRSANGLFEVDLTQPYIDKVEVNGDNVNLGQFTLGLKDSNISVYAFDSIAPDKIARHIFSYTSSLQSKEQWNNMSVEDALKKLPHADVKDIISKAIALASPMCPLNYDGYIAPVLNNYYYIGVEEQSATGLNGNIININQCIPSDQTYASYFASTGSKDQIIFYHQYGVFPTYTISGFKTYHWEHEEYMKNPTAFSLFIDEVLRTKIMRDGFSVFPQERHENSLEMWVKGLIFGLITRDEDGNYFVRDESNAEYALDDYRVPLNSKYRDEAYQNFRRESSNLLQQFEEYLINRTKLEGEDSINKILADAKLNYLDKYSLNKLTKTERDNPLYAGIKKQLIREIEYVNKEL